MKISRFPATAIGPEIVEGIADSASRLHAISWPGLSFDHDDVGFVSLEKHGTTLRESVLEKARSYDGIILGTQSHAINPRPEKGGRNISASFRVGLISMRMSVRRAPDHSSPRTCAPAGRWIS